MSTLQPLATLFLALAAAPPGLALPQGMPPFPPGHPLARALERHGPPTLPFAVIAEQPSAFVGRRLRLVVQLHSIEEQWNPFVTRFAPRNYIGLRCWTDEQLPWNASDFDHRPVRAFVPRGTTLETFFRLGQPHERIALVCTVREVFAGQPWIEVESAELTPASIPEGSVLHAIRAFEFETHGAYGLALGELDRALAAPLPEHAFDALLEVKKRCLAGRER